MKKLLLFFSLLTCMMMCQWYSGQTFTIPVCSGAIGTNSYGVPNSNTSANAKSRGAFIIPSSQLMSIADGTITSTYFKRLSSSGTLNSGTTFKIYLKNTSATDWGSPSLDWATAITGATLVYDSDPASAIGSTAGFKQFVHATNFVYTAGSNLAVFTEYIQTTAQSATINWEYEYSSPCVNTSNSNTTKYVTTTSAFGATLTSSDYRRPHIAFDATVPPPTTPPSCTTISAPANAATGVSLTPTITWAATPITASYVINVGTMPGGTDVINGMDVGNVTSYAIPTASPLAYSTQYYVTVFPKNSIGQAAGCTESTFTTLTMPCPTVNSPSASATGVSTLPTITWSSVAAATGYRLTVGTTSGGTEILNNIDLGNVTSYTFSTLLNPSTTYYYKVTAYNASANSGTGCTVRSFTTTAAPPPANDNCSAAVALTVNPDLSCGTITAGNTLGASMSMAATPCSGNPDDDVWYSFVATGASHVVTLSNVVSTGTTTASDMYFQVLSGTCGSLTSVLCSDPNTATVTGLTPGQTYYVRVYTFSGAGYNTSFNICIGTPPPPPANDECTGAIALTVNPDLNCTSVGSGNTLWATTSMAATPCSGNPDDDVWYSFVATGASHVVTLSNVVSTGTSTASDMYFQVLSGTCGSLTSVLCSDPNTATLTGLTPGQTYYVRVYTFSGAGYNTSFNICIGTPPPPPANDECTGAIALTVNPDLNCASVGSGNTLSATTSMAATPCSGNPDDDVWYSFVATGASHVVTLSNVVSTGTTTTSDVYFQVLSGTCGSLTSVLCSDPNTATVTGLTPGQTYYVRVYTFSGAGYNTSFNICIGTPPPPPANDDCSGAISLTVGGVFADNAITTSNAGATTDGTTSCQSSRGDNVWFSVVVPASGNVTVETKGVAGSGLLDTVLSAHSGTCGSLTSVACNDDISVGMVYSLISLTGQTPGSTLYFSVWRYTGSAGGTSVNGQFQISAYDASLVLATDEVKDNSKNAIKVYPNPFNDVLNISDASNVKNALITDIAGRLVKTIANPGSQLQLGELKQGMYLVTLEMKDGSRQTIKAIKK
jgi:trimeric autotransporter adhesin